MVSEKTKKPWSGTRDKSTSNHRPGEKEKSFLGKKERKGQPRIRLGVPSKANVSRNV